MLLPPPSVSRGLALPRPSVSGELDLRMLLPPRVSKDLDLSTVLPPRVSRDLLPKLLRFSKGSGKLDLRILLPPRVSRDLDLSMSPPPRVSRDLRTTPPPSVSSDLFSGVAKSSGSRSSRALPSNWFPPRDSSCLAERLRDCPDVRRRRTAMAEVRMLAIFVL